MNPLLPEPVDFQGFFHREKIKVRNRLYQRLRTFVVREAGLEPARPEWTLEPESSESANSTTRAALRSSTRDIY